MCCNRKVVVVFFLYEKSLVAPKGGMPALSTIRGNKNCHAIAKTIGLLSLQDSGDKKHAPHLYIHLLTQEEPKWISHMLWT